MGKKLKLLSKTKRIEIYKDWIKALKGGRYKQTYFELHNEDGYCCLGVLCERNKKIFGLKKELNENVFQYNEEESLLPTNVTILMGLTDCAKIQESVALGNNEYTALIELNDNGMPFKEIADVIQKQLLKPLTKRKPLTKQKEK